MRPYPPADGGKIGSVKKLWSALERKSNCFGLFIGQQERTKNLLRGCYGRAIHPTTRAPRLLHTEVGS